MDTNLLKWILTLLFLIASTLGISIPTDISTYVGTIYTPAVPVATYPPTPTQEVATLGINVSTVPRNVRNCPRTDCTIVGQLAVGASVYLYSDIVEFNNGYVWMQIMINGGWVALERINPSEFYIRLQEVG